MRWNARVGDREHQLEMTRKPGGAIKASVDGRQYTLNVSEPQAGIYSLLCEGESHEAIVQQRHGRYRVRVGPWVFEVEPVQPLGADLTGGAERSNKGGKGTIRSVMPGRVLRVLIQPGQRVSARQGLVVVEAMKMENEVIAPRDGVVKEVRVAPGSTVETGEILAVIE